MQLVAALSCFPAIRYSAKEVGQESGYPASSNAIRSRSDLGVGYAMRL